MFTIDGKDLMNNDAVLTSVPLQVMEIKSSRVVPAYLKCIKSERRPKRILEWEPQGSTKRDRLPLNWEVYINKAMGDKGLEEGNSNIG